MASLSQSLATGEYLCEVAGPMESPFEKTVVYKLKNVDGSDTRVYESWDTVLEPMAADELAAYQARMQALIDHVTCRITGVFRITVENGETGSKITKVEKVMEA